MNFSLKDKFPPLPLTSLPVPWRLLLAVLFVQFCVTGTLAQERPGVKSQIKEMVTNQATKELDTLPKSHMSDSVQAKRRKSEIETTITYTARDSINSSMDRKIVHLYGNAKIVYGPIQLSAEEITIDYEKSTISANGTLDSLGRRVGYPIFVNGSEKYETKNIVYNFKTKKAKITEVVTNQGEGYLHGNAVFKNEKNELLSVRNAYTTCNLAHPHYQIIATKAKAIPGDKMVVGPFYMELNNVPLPAGFLFGIFPSPRKSASGIIVPAYGEERNRGFFLRNGGYFFDINDYVKLQVTGDLYSKGSSALYVNSSYMKRYKYNGNFNFSFTSNYSSGNVESATKINDFRIVWNHTPQTKGTGRFSASVNAATSTYNSTNFLPMNTNPATMRLDNGTRKLSSNVSYSKTFGSKFSLGVNLRHNQDVYTKQVDLPLPDVSFNINNLYPFKKVSDGMFFQNFSMRYTMNGTNQITNNLGRIKKYDPTTDSIAPFNTQNLPYFFKHAKNGVRHSIPISTSFKILKFFTASVGGTLDELWYFQKLNWGYSADGQSLVVKDTVQGFNQVTNYSASVNLTTRIYGTVFFKKPTGIQAIRHIINPSVGMSFQPDFGDPSYGYYQKFTLPNNPYPVYKSVHEGFVYGSSRTGRAAAMSFGINNNIEMKVKSKKDTVAKKIPLFNTLSISSSYNFVADSFRLAPFTMAGNTNILQDKLNINMTATLDPYKYVTMTNGTVTVERRTSSYAWGQYSIPENSGSYRIVKEGSGVGRITAANLALSTNLNPKGQKKDSDTRDKISKANIGEGDRKYLLANPDAYIDFNIPWNLRISYNVDYSHPANSDPKITQAARFNGDFSLTEKWKITFNSGYDFQQNDFTQTYLTIARDLHCWQVNLSWVPFGKYQSYSFYIGIKSSLLKDLKLNRTRSFFDN